MYTSSPSGYMVPTALDTPHLPRAVEADWASHRSHLDEVQVVVVTPFGRCVVDPTAGELVLGVTDDVVGVEVGEDVDQCPSVPVIRHAAAVVALPGHVCDGIKGYVCVLVDVHLQLPYADAEVGLVEAVRDVPPKWSKVPPLLNEGVEETETKQELLKHLQLKEENDQVCTLGGSAYYHIPGTHVKWSHSYVPPTAMRGHCVRPTPLE